MRVRGEGHAVGSPSSTFCATRARGRAEARPSDSSPLASYPSLLIRHLGLVPYEPTWRGMQRFTAERTRATPDELWLLQHPPVYTLGQAGDPRHLLDDNGNGLQDEAGFTVCADGIDTLRLRLTLEGRDPKNNLVNRTVETSVHLRN